MTAGDRQYRGQLCSRAYSKHRSRDDTLHMHSHYSHKPRNMETVTPDTDQQNSYTVLLCYQETWRSSGDTNPLFLSRCLTPGITEILLCAAPSYRISWIEITQFCILFSVSSSFRGSGECSTS